MKPQYPRYVGIVTFPHSVAALVGQLEGERLDEETSSVLSQIILSTVAVFTEHHNKAVPSHACLPNLDQLLLCESSRALLSTEVIEKPARILTLSFTN